MTTLSARERILGKLRAAGAQPPIGVAEIDTAINAHYSARRPTRPMSIPESVDAMRAALTTAHAEVICASAASWPAQLAERLTAAGVQRLLIDPETPEGAALTGALPDSIEALPFAAPIEAWKRELFETVDAGFTVARSGIAATGTLIVAPDRGSPRTMSLVPPLHIALVRASSLHPDLHSAAKTERWSAGMPTNLVLISGPSKTSDIQQTLAYGAHGPRWMWVVIVIDRIEADGADQ